jgi:hypothetical protein
MNREELFGKSSAAQTKRAISTEEGLAAATVIIEQAGKEEIEYALAGGIAMHLYGYLRATQDVDMLAADKLSLPAERSLSFGGESYVVKVGEREINVDVIVRNDFFREFYAAALRDAQMTADGWRVITPEWMVILKYLAGRGKDQLDLLWLLREPGLVDRTEVTRLLEQVAGQTSAQIALRGLEPFYVQAAVMRAGDENGNPE